MRFTIAFLVAAALVFAQGPRGKQPPPRGPLQWWEGPMIRGVNLTEAQTRQVQSTMQEYRSRMMDARTSVDRAEVEMEEVFNDGNADTRKANDAIEHLAAARADLTRVLSHMSLKVRSLLTDEQWQELQKREQAGRQRFDAKPGPRPAGGPGGGAPRTGPRRADKAQTGQGQQ